MKRYFFEVTIVFAELQLFVCVALVFGSDVSAWSLSKFTSFRAFKSHYNSVCFLCHKAEKPRLRWVRGQDFNAQKIQSFWGFVAA